jgi:sulfate adenylyltransferase subunit 1
MDLVEYSQERFAEIVADFAPLLEKLGVEDWLNIPISALRGDNVVDALRADAVVRRPDAALSHLEQVEVSYDHPYDVPARFPVQWVVRTGGSDGEYRGYAGQLASGALRAGEEVVVLPSGSARGSPRSTPTRASSTRRSRRSRSRCASRTTSTSPAAS